MGSSVLVTGGAGFIGSHLVEKLLAVGRPVHLVDDLSGGSRQFVEETKASHSNFVFHKTDLLDFNQTKKIFSQAQPETVFHFAANPAANLGADEKRTHLNQNLVATYNVLDAMRSTGAKKMVFASTSTVYGRAENIPTPESEPFKPISLYGATKAGCESLCSSFAENHGWKASCIRFANVVGQRGTHGVLVDFVKKLRKNPKKLEVLGDGKQNKSYVFVKDAVQAALLAEEKNNSFYNAFNVGSSDSVSVTEIAEIVVKKTGLAGKVKIVYKGGEAWKGDVTQMQLDCSKIRKMGWMPKHNSRQAVEKTLDWLVSKY